MSRGGASIRRKRLLDQQKVVFRPLHAVTLPWPFRSANHCRTSLDSRRKRDFAQIRSLRHNPAHVQGHQKRGREASGGRASGDATRRAFLERGHHGCAHPLCGPEHPSARPAGAVLRRGARCGAGHADGAGPTAGYRGRVHAGRPGVAADGHVLRGADHQLPCLARLCPLWHRGSDVAHHQYPAGDGHAAAGLGFSARVSRRPGRSPERAAAGSQPQLRLLVAHRRHRVAAHAAAGHRDPVEPLAVVWPWPGRLPGAGCLLLGLRVDHQAAVRVVVDRAGGRVAAAQPLPATRVGLGCLALAAGAQHGASSPPGFGRAGTGKRALAAVQPARPGHGAGHLGQPDADGAIRRQQPGPVGQPAHGLSRRLPHPAAGRLLVRAHGRTTREPAGPTCFLVGSHRAAAAQGARVAALQPPPPGPVLRATGDHHRPERNHHQQPGRDPPDDPVAHAPGAGRRSHGQRSGCAVEPSAGATLALDWAGRRRSVGVGARRGPDHLAVPPGLAAHRGHRLVLRCHLRAGRRPGTSWRHAHHCAGLGIPSQPAALDRGSSQPGGALHLWLCAR